MFLLKNTTAELLTTSSQVVALRLIMFVPVRHTRFRPTRVFEHSHCKYSYALCNAPLS